MFSAIKKRITDERGATLVLVALSMVALVSVAALAVDVGMLLTARSEAQRVADLSALAGAGALAQLPDNADLAREVAIRYAEMNDIRRDSAIVDEGDVQVDLAEGRVTVTVYRTSDRGNPVNTFFARVFGVNDADISAIAAAEAMDPGPDYGVVCPLPIAVPDRWLEQDGTWSDKNDTFDPPNDFYDVDATGYNETSIGDPVFLRQAGGGGGNMNQSWYYPWTPFADENAVIDGGGGGSNYRERFSGCMEGLYETGTVVYSEPGAMVGPTDKGFKDLYALDPTAYWNQSGGPAGCVARPSAVTETNVHGCVDGSPRVKAVPMFDPGMPPEIGRNELTITKVGSMFVEGKEGGDFFGRWLGTTGVVGKGESDPASGSIAKALRLVQ